MDKDIDKFAYDDYNEFEIFSDINKLPSFNILSKTPYIQITFQLKLNKLPKKLICQYLIFNNIGIKKIICKLYHLNYINCENNNIEIIKFENINRRMSGFIRNNKVMYKFKINKDIILNNCLPFPNSNLIVISKNQLLFCYREK